MNFLFITKHTHTYIQQKLSKLKYMNMIYAKEKEEKKQKTRKQSKKKRN